MSVLHKKQYSIGLEYNGIERWYSAYILRKGRFIVVAIPWPDEHNAKVAFDELLKNEMRT